MTLRQFLFALIFYSDANHVTTSDALARPRWVCVLPPTRFQALNDLCNHHHEYPHCYSPLLLLFSLVVVIYIISCSDTSCNLNVTQRKPWRASRAFNREGGTAGRLTIQSRPLVLAPHSASFAVEEAFLFGFQPFHRLGEFSFGFPFTALVPTSSAFASCEPLEFLSHFFLPSVSLVIQV